MKKNKKIIIICAIIVALIIISIIITVIHKRKTENTPTENKKAKEKFETVKIIENQTMKVILGEVSTTNEYMIIEYDVDIKNKDLGLDSGYLDDVALTLERDIKIDGNILEIYKEDGQFAYKESDGKVKVYDFINIKDKKIPDTYKLEIDVYDIYEQGSEEVSEAEINDATSDEASDDANDETDNTEDEEFVEDTSEDNYEEVTIDSDEYYQAIENIDDSDENVTEDEEWTIQDTDEEDNNERSSDITQIGAIKVELNKTDTNKNANTIGKNEKQTQDNVTTTINSVIKTNTAKFLIIESEVKNVTKTQIEENDLSNPDNLQISIQDKDGNNINIKKNESDEIYNQDGKVIDNLSEEENLENGTVKKKTVIGLFGENKNLTNIKIQPYFIKSTENIDNRNWYSIEDQKQSEENDHGGKIEITKIEKTEDTATFYFTKTGFVEAEDAIIIIRDKENNNYIIPDKIEEIKDNQYKAEFYIENAEDKEFTISERNEIQILGEGIVANV